MLKKQNKNRTINVGLIGYGYWAPNIAKNLALNPKVNLKWICDKNVERIEKAKSIYASQVKYSYDYKEIVNDPTLDAVAIAVETSSHYKLAKQALTMGKHIFVEKPFTSNVKEAIELNKIAKSSSLKIHVNHIMVYNSEINKIKELIDKNHIGDILYIDAMRMNLGQIRKDISAMWDLALHDLVVIDHLTEGKEPYFISALGEKFYNPKESVSFLTMRYPGFISHIQSSWISPKKERKLGRICSFVKPLCVNQEAFLNSNDKLPNKDKIFRNKSHLKIRTIDLHGYTLEQANKYIEDFVIKSYEEKINKLIVVTGKGIHSQNEKDPYVSKDLSILKYSVPEFISNNKNLMKIIYEMKDAKIEDGGGGAFYIFLKKNKL